MPQKEWKKAGQNPIWNAKDEHGDIVLKDGAELVGVFVSKRENIGDFNSTLYDIETEAGVVSLWGNTVLDLRLKNVKEGDEVRIVYLGFVPSKKRKGKKFYNFEVYHRDPENPVPKTDDIPVIDETPKKNEEDVTEDEKYKAIFGNKDEEESEEEKPQ